MPSSSGVDSTQELLDAQAHIWNHIFNHINSMTLKWAVQLGIPDIIHKHDKPMTLSQLADAIPINRAKSDALHRIMRILVHSKFFDRVRTLPNEEEAYCLTRASRLLLRDEPLSLTPFALAVLDEDLMGTFHCVPEWFGNECPSPLEFKHEKSIREFAENNQRWSLLFNEGMANDARLVGSILAKESRKVFEGLETMVDVGGGTGMVSKAIVDAFPGMKGIVLDLPYVVSGLKGSGNLRYVGGDMFHSVPPADAVFLKWILHNWSDDECIKILEKCKEAITTSKNMKGGKVIIVDMILGYEKQQDEAVETQLFFDMMMMTTLTGKERTEQEWAKIFFAAGFKTYKIYPLLGLRSLIEVFP
uniref:Flavonoid 8-O-methyltransferase 1 n=1 Tax=Ocimum basilicum TaxID=39350 RepID=F8MT1_OCIBA|nr:RecName: Full=Flavonoid 8-O-methyltransferase 1; Short=ObF8OMT-1; AltName: Full=8-hydroxysalvigenin 8-O-methyltransferase; AltName: Full=Pilosin 8-O-methyltransferase [Ocimum basilicum]AGQ21572.1 flavone 8-O-methyltransferase [Ocimum basilicum]